MAIEIEVDLKDGVSAGARSASSGVEGLASKLGGLGGAAGGLGGKLGPLSQSLMKLLPGDLSSKLQGAIGQVEGLGASAEGIAGKLGGLGGDAEALGGSLGGLGAEAAAAAGPLAALAVGLGLVAAILFKGAEMALDANKATNAIKGIGDAFGKGPEAGAQFLAMINGLSEKLPQSRQQLSEWSRTLMAAGVTDMSKLQSQLTAIASAEALMGEQGEAAAAKVTKLFAKISEASQMGQPLKVTAKDFQGIGVSAEDVAAKLGISASKLQAELKAGTVDAAAFGTALQEALIEKGAGPLGKMTASLGTLKAKLVENIQRLFEGVDVTPFTSGMKAMFGELTKMFSSSSESGKAMKGVITQVFSAIFAVAGAVFPAIVVGIKGLAVILGVVGAVLGPLFSAFGWAFNALGGVKALTAALKVLVVILEVLAVVAAVALLPLFIGIAIIVAPLILIGALFMWVAGLITDVGSAASDAFSAIPDMISAIPGAIANFVSQAIATLMGLPAAAMAAGSDFISGLVGGISSGAGAVVSAMKALASSAVSAFKAAMGISSPSKVMAIQGGHTTAGVAEGVKAGAPLVEASTRDVGHAAVKGMSSAIGGGKASTAVQAGQARAGASAHPALAPVPQATGEALSVAMRRAPSPDRSSSAPSSAPAGGSSSSSSKGGGVTFNLAPGSIVINASGMSADEVLKLTEESLIALLERVGAQQGAVRS